MEQFLSNEEEEEIEEAPKPRSNLSASEKLKQLKGEEELETTLEKVEDTEEEIDEEPVKKEKKSKKRRGPPKGGSFGPTVGGF